ncbi:MAG: ankyrin repeat domain-containing protein [bacterium]
MSKIKIILTILFFAAMSYLGLSIYNASRLPIYYLVFYTVNPEQYFKDTGGYVPHIEKFSFVILKNKNQAELNTFFDSDSGSPLVLLQTASFSGRAQQNRLQVAMKVTDYLIEKGLSVTKLDRYGCSPIHNALYQEQEVLAHHLVERFKIKEIQGNTDSVIDFCKRDLVLKINDSDPIELEN